MTESDTTFDARAFLDWLADQPEYVARESVESEWPGFTDEYALVGVTSWQDDGKTMTAKRNYRKAVLFGWGHD